MGRIYDGEKHVALEAERTRLQGAINEIAVKMNDEYESDAWTGDEAPGKVARYQADNIRHMQLTRELGTIETEIDRMEAIRPISRAEHRANPVLDIRRRWCAQGAKALDEGERQIFVPDDTEEVREYFAKRGLPAEGEFFDPWGMATDYGKNPLPAVPRGRMVAGDGSRSDVHTPGTDGTNLNPAAPETWAAGVVESLRYYGSVASNCHNFNTSDGNKFHQNGLDTKDEEGKLIVAQGSSGADVPDANSTTIGNAADIIFDSFWVTSNFVEARIETFQDIHFDVASRVMREMERRLGRGWNRYFTVGGGGTAAPEGIAMSAMVVNGGAGSADDNTGGISYENLLDMEYAIDLAYLESGEGGEGGFMDAHGGMIGWMMHRNVEKQLRLATLFPSTTQIAAAGSAGSAAATGGLPIWVPDPTNAGIATQRAPGRILGYPYTINNHMGTGKKQTDLSTDNIAGASSLDADELPPLLFGACGHFGVRNIGGPLFYRFWDSETAARMGVKFLGFSRRDSRTRGPVGGSGTRAAAVQERWNEAYCILHVKT